MNIRTSECSSGCESGWTTYLENFSNSTNPYSMNCVQNYEERGANVNENENEEEDEDLSMVSDASSGPPNLRENYVSDPRCYGYASSLEEDMKKNKSKTKETKVKKKHSFCLDDTATSSMLHFSQENGVPPQHHKSLEHFEDEITPKKRLGFLKSSTKGKSASLLGRKRQ